MKHLAISLLTLSLTLLVIPDGFTAAPSKDERNLEKEIAGLDKTATEPGGEQAVLARIEQDFKIAPERVRGLRTKGLGYGEIITMLSLAQKMPGGVADENIDRIRSLRQGPPPLGWGMVAKQVGAKLGMTVSRVKRVHNETHRSMKQGTVRSTAAPTTPGGDIPPRRREPRRDFPGEGKSLPQGRAAD